jgi:thiol-disulfide isomerase/thioredoxin
MTPVGRAALALILVAGAGPAGFLIYHAVFNSHPLPNHRSDPPAAVNAGQAASAPPGAARATPLTLPDLALPDSNGKIHPLTEYRGHPLVLNFWATWCEPCQREIPLLESMHRDLGISVQIVGVAVDFQKDVLPFAQARGITYPLLMGEKDGLAAVTAFGMEPAFPFTVFADDRGNIVAVKVGELHLDEAKLILSQVAAVDAGKIGLANARGAVSAGLRALAIAHAQQPAGPSAAVGGKS